MFRLERITAQAPAPMTNIMTEAMINRNAGLSGWFFTDFIIS